MPAFFALTTRGLEPLTAEAAAALPGVTVTQTAYRRVMGAAADLAPLLNLRTADDVFIRVAAWNSLDRPRSALDDLRVMAAVLDLHQAAAWIDDLRRIAIPPRFSVTASFVGKRNYTSDEIKQVCAEEIARTHGWPYTRDDDEADLNLRVFIEGETAEIGLRVGRRPLQDRFYKQTNLPGSTKPPVAAALALLAGAAPKRVLVDPCCGAGTILAEAGLLGAAVRGGDRDPAAVTAARGNLRAAGLNVRVERWDVRALPLDDESVESIATNLPWGEQVNPDEALPEFYTRACTELRRVLAPGGRIALLTSHPDLVALADLALLHRFEISLSGQRPHVLVFGRSG